MFFLMVQILSHLHLPNSKWPLSGALPHRRPGHRAGTRHRSGALAPVRGRQTAAPGPRRPRDRRCPSPGWCPPRLRAGPNFWGSPGQRQLPRMAFGPKYLDKWTNITEKMVGKCCSWPHRLICWSPHLPWSQRSESRGRPSACRPCNISADTWHSKQKNDWPSVETTGLSKALWEKQLAVPSRHPAKDAA